MNNNEEQVNDYKEKMKMYCKEKCKNDEYLNMILERYWGDGDNNNYLEIFYNSEWNREKNLYKKVNEYLKRLEQTGDFFKIKHIKKLYEYYNILYNLKKYIFIEDTFEDGTEYYLDDFYHFLIYTIDCLKSDFVKIMDEVQKDDFRNDEPLDKTLDENKEKFSIYLKFKHFYL